MKKDVLVSLLVLALAGNVFAQINTSLWARAIWAPIVFDADGAVDSKGENVPGTGTVVGPDWGAPVNLCLGFKGQNQNGTAGFNVDLRMTYTYGSNTFGNIHPYNNVHLWTKPFTKKLRFMFGKYKIEEISGGLGNFIFFDQSNYRPEFYNEGAFESFKNNIGTLITYDYHGLYIGANLGATGNQDASTVDVFEHGIADNFTLGQYAISYTIPYIVNLKTQFHGGRIYAKDWKNLGDDQVRDYSYFQACVKLLTLGSIGGIDITGTIPLSYEAAAGTGINAVDAASMGTGTSFSSDMKINPGALLRVGLIFNPLHFFGFNTAVSFDIGSKYTSVNGNDNGTTGHILKINVEPQFNFSVLSVGIDCAFRWIGDGEFNGTTAKTGRSDIMIMPYVNKEFGGFGFRAGFAFDTNLRQSNGTIDKFRIALPIVVEIGL
jgi:hypothetical protein